MASVIHNSYGVSAALLLEAKELERWLDSNNSPSTLWNGTWTAAPSKAHSDSSDSSVRGGSLATESYDDDGTDGGLVAPPSFRAGNKHSPFEILSACDPAKVLRALICCNERTHPVPRALQGAFEVGIGRRDTSKAD